MNIYNIIDIQSKKRIINPHIGKEYCLLKGILIVTDALTSTKCLLVMGVGVEVA